MGVPAPNVPIPLCEKGVFALVVGDVTVFVVIVFIGCVLHSTYNACGLHASQSLCIDIVISTTTEI